MSTCRIAVLISGGGTTLKNLIDQIAAGKLDRIQIQRVVSSSGKAKGLGYAEEAGIPSRVIRTTDDAGVVHLIDDRFARPEVRRLLPAWWACPA